MIHRYAQWTRRQASSAQCSPALAVLGMVVAFAVVVYIYRQVILTTVITAALAAVSVAVFVGAIALTISTLRWYRKRSRAVTAEIVDSKLEPPDTWTRRRTDDAEVAAISDEAEWLASGVELAFTPDGKSLVARGKAK
jgi:hypothetical protein